MWHVCLIDKDLQGEVTTSQMCMFFSLNVLIIHQETYPLFIGILSIFITIFVNSYFFIFPFLVVK
jgi:hypothetical protein